MQKLFENMTELDKAYERDIIRSMLFTSKLKVTFEKVDGTTKEMICTLMEDLLPEREVSVLNETYESKKIRTNHLLHLQCRVWDLEKQDWRSFLYERVIDYCVVE